MKILANKCEKHELTINTFSLHNLCGKRLESKMLAITSSLKAQVVVPHRTLVHVDHDG